MNTITDAFIRVVDFLNKIVGVVISVIIWIMSILILWQVITRNISGASLVFAEEASRFMMVWLILMGASYAVRKNELISVDFIPEMLKGKSKAILQFFAYLLSIIFYIILIVFGWELAQKVSYQVAPSTGISMFWPMLSMVVAGVMMLINTLANIIEMIPGKKVS